MKNRLLILMVVLIAGCSDKVEYTKVLKDPITLNLVKQSVGYSMYYSYPANEQSYEYVYYNSCSLWSRLKTSCVLFFHPMAAVVSRNIFCDALDLRLKKQNLTISSSALVKYYMNEQTEKQEKANNLRIKSEATSKQNLIESMAYGT